MANNPPLFYASVTVPAPPTLIVPPPSSRQVPPPPTLSVPPVQMPMPGKVPAAGKPDNRPPPPPSMAAPTDFRSALMARFAARNAASLSKPPTGLLESGYYPDDHEEDKSIKRSNPVSECITVRRDKCDYICDFRKWQEKGNIGMGSYGMVSIVLNPETGEEAVLKKILISEECETHSMTSESFLREVDALVQLQHPCILRIVGFSLPSNDSIGQIGTEYHANGSLARVLRQRDKWWNHTVATKAIIGICCGMKHCHSHGFMHRDIKPSNILFKSNYEICIADFGTSREISLDQTQTSDVGTLAYIAPEVCLSNSYDERIDVFSFGRVFYEIVTGKSSFKSIAMLTNSEIRCHCPRPGQDIHPHVARLITSCLATDPGSRPAFADILNELERHDFVVFGDEDRDAIQSYVRILKESH